MGVLATDIWTIVIASVVAMSCALLGCFLILRKMAMISDAISHAVLPGIVIAYIFNGELDYTIMLVGAIATGLVTSILIEFLKEKVKIQADASIGITYTLLFAFGIILLSMYDNIAIKSDHVLQGNLEFVAQDIWIYQENYNLGPIAFWVSLLTFISIIAYVIIGFKGLKATTFNPAFASLIGLSSAFWHYSLMSAVSVTTVVSFNSIGAILVIGFMIIPPATAYLITKRLKQMLWLACGFGTLASVLGFYLASYLNSSIAGSICVTMGIIFAAVLVFTKMKQKQNKIQPLAN